MKLEEAASRIRDLGRDNQDGWRGEFDSVDIDALNMACVALEENARLREALTGIRGRANNVWNMDWVRDAVDAALAPQEETK